MRRDGTGGFMSKPSNDGKELHSGCILEVKPTVCAEGLVVGQDGKKRARDGSWGLTWQPERCHLEKWQ